MKYKHVKYLFIFGNLCFPRFAGLKFEGRAHSGLDDSYNIARMFIHLLSDGAIIRTNERITQHCRSHVSTIFSCKFTQKVSTETKNVYLGENNPRF